jgi:hypothetical protein
MQDPDSLIPRHRHVTAFLELRDGSATTDPRLDRCPQYDARSLQFPIARRLTAEQYRAPRSYTWRLEHVLDQGDEGACVGFGWAHELAARPGVVTGIDARYAHDHIYWPAQMQDEWPGGSYPGASPQYEGTSVLGGAKAVKAAGWISEYRWALTPDDLIIAVGYAGPAVIGINWYRDMFTPDADGYVRPTGPLAGGHCVVVTGVQIVLDPGGRNIDNFRSSFIVTNSWGPTWGHEGRARISFADMLKLWPGGEFCIPLGRLAGVAR